MSNSFHYPFLVPLLFPILKSSQFKNSPNFHFSTSFVLFCVLLFILLSVLKKVSFFTRLLVCAFYLILMITDCFQSKSMQLFVCVFFWGGGLLIYFWCVQISFHTSVFEERHECDSRGVNTATAGLLSSVVGKKRKQQTRNKKGDYSRSITSWPFCRAKLGKAPPCYCDRAKSTRRRNAHLEAMPPEPLPHGCPTVKHHVWGRRWEDGWKSWQRAGVSLLLAGKQLWF